MEPLFDSSRKWATEDETDNLPRYRRGRRMEPLFNSPAPLAAWALTATGPCRDCGRRLYVDRHDRCFKCWRVARGLRPWPPDQVPVDYGPDA